MRSYQNLIFTNHAFNRLKDRSINEDAVWQTIKWPEKKYPKDDKVKFIKTVNQRRLHVIASWIETEKKWLVISVWVRGEEDKLPLVWQIIVLPFKITYWLLTRGIKLLLNK